MDVREALYTTRAMRRVTDEPIPADVQQRILDAAIRAPSGGNMQNWRFVLVVGLALAGPDSLPLSSHQAFDLTLVAALGGGGVGLALSGDPAAGLLLIAIGGLQLALTGLTRWTRA